MEEGGADEGVAQRDAIAARMRAEDYAGARTLLLETLQANPRLEGAVEMLSVLEVLCAAAGKPALSGPGGGSRGVDWYRVLQVLPGDGADRVESRFRYVVAQVEQAVGEVPGAELALRLVHEAYAVLSDPAKREGFDSMDVFTQLARSGAVYAPTPGNAAVGSDRLDSLGTKDIRTVDAANNALVSRIQHTGNSCPDQMNSYLSNVASSSKTKMDYCFPGDGGELQSPDGTHVDKKQKSVSEEDVCGPSPSQVDFDGCFSDPPDPEDNGRCSGKKYDYHNFEDDRAMECFSAGQVWAAFDWERLPRRYALIIEVLTDKMQLQVSWFKPCPQSHEEKKWSSAELPFVCGTFIAEECQISLTCPTVFCHQISSYSPNQHLEVYPQKGQVWAIYSDWDIGWCADPGMRKQSSFSVVEILTTYSKESGCTVVHLVKVDGHRSVFRRYLRRGTEQLLQVHSNKLLMFAHMIPSFRFTNEVGTMFELEHSMVPENLQRQNTLECVAPSSPLPGFHNDMNGFREADVAQLSNPSTSKMDLGAPQQGMMNCNNNLSPKDFVEGHIWAVYDSWDRMPRSYVRIIRMVSSTSVFVLKLEPHPMLNEEIRWVEDGLPVACGVFRAGTETIYKDIWEFSHPVECDWSAKRSFYRIFPKKGEIWAMYKNWKITSSRTDIDNYEPRMVEILSDYSDENGVNACCLARLKGCLTFFHRVVMEDFHLTRSIPRSEMLSFSHRVPAYVVIEIKDRDIPKGSWHLEPSALPTRIIH